MNRVAIALRTESFIKNVSMLLGKLIISEKLKIKIKNEDYEIIIVEMPYSTDTKTIERSRKIFEKYCEKKGLHMIDGESTSCDEKNKIYAIKVLSSLEALKDTKGLEIRNKKFGVTCRKLNPILIEALSYDSLSIVIFDREFNLSKKEKLYKKIIVDKGLSIAYTKDRDPLMKNSDIIIGDNFADKSIILDKISIIEDWEEVILLPKGLCLENDGFSKNNFNHQIIKVFLYFNRDMEVRDIASSFTVSNLGNLP